MAANAQSPVVEGQHYSDESIRYTLEDKTRYKLDAQDRRSLTKPVRWLHG